MPHECCSNLSLETFVQTACTRRRPQDVRWFGVLTATSIVAVREKTFAIPESRTRHEQMVIVWSSFACSNRFDSTVKTRYFFCTRLRSSSSHVSTSESHFDVRHGILNDIIYHSALLSIILIFSLLYNHERNENLFYKHESAPIFYFIYFSEFFER